MAVLGRSSFNVLNRELASSELLLSERMVSFWTSFSVSGVPTDEEAWPPFLCKDCCKYHGLDDGMMSIPVAW